MPALSGNAHELMLRGLTVEGAHTSANTLTRIKRGCLSFFFID